MATTIAYAEKRKRKRVLVVSRRRARLNEALIGLLFVTPAAVVVIVFNLFPLVYGFYLSMQGGVALPTGFVGLDQYVRALGGLAYIVSTALALAFGIGGYGFFRNALAHADRGGRAVESADESGAPLVTISAEEQQARRLTFYRYLIPGFIAGPSTLIFFVILFMLNISYTFPAVLTIGAAVAMYAYLDARYHGQMAAVIGSWVVGFMSVTAVGLLLFTAQELYRYVAPSYDVISRAIANPEYNLIVPLMPQIIAAGGALVGAAAIYFTHRLRRQLDSNVHPQQTFWLGLLRWVMLFVVGGFIIYVLGAQELLRGSLVELGKVDAATLRQFTRLRLPELVEQVSIWQEVFTVLLGISMTGLAIYFWNGARHRETGLGLLGALMVAILFMIGGWLLLGELPAAAASGDEEFYQSILRTVTYAALTVPIQLGIGLFLAYLLYYEVRWGKSLYRIIFFVPYIAPTVATATVFAMIFSLRDTSPANQIMQALGLPAQQWLRDPRGIFEIIAQTVGGSDVRLPDFLVGPSLPLLSAIVYGIWVFSGYNAVIFLAGLGNIPKEMYEAAQVDGAGRWETFRSIIFPLISPVTFFLTLLAVIGTFRAFQHIYVLRTPAARGAMDTTTVYIYELIRMISKPRPYAAALSLILFGIILVLTLVQNRLSRDRVFYG